MQQLVWQEELSSMACCEEFGFFPLEDQADVWWSQQMMGPRVSHLQAGAEVRRRHRDRRCVWVGTRWL